MYKKQAVKMALFLYTKNIVSYNRTIILVW